MSDLIDGLFYSPLLGKDTPYRVLVPGNVSPADSLPVLYLLHGLFGSFTNWTDLTDLKRYSKSVKFLIVMPEGGDNWYTDGAEKHESYLLKELLPEIENRFNASTDRSQRSIAGNSMGGYGALKIGLKHPALFGLAASFSGAFHAARGLDLPGDAELLPSVTKVFGSDKNSLWIENDLFNFGERAGMVAKDMPDIYFDCGLSDQFISANREMDAALSKAGIEHEYSEIEGGHVWDYWDSRIKHLIPVLNDKLLPINQ